MYHTCHRVEFQAESHGPDHVSGEPRHDFPRVDPRRATFGGLFLTNENNFRECESLIEYCDANALYQDIVGELVRGSKKQREHGFDFGRSEDGGQLGPKRPPLLTREADQVRRERLSRLVYVDTSVDKMLEVFHQALLYQLGTSQEQCRSPQLVNTDVLVRVVLPVEN